MKMPVAEVCCVPEVVMAETKLSLMVTLDGAATVFPSSLIPIAGLVRVVPDSAAVAVIPVTMLSLMVMLEAAGSILMPNALQLRQVTGVVWTTVNPLNVTLEAFRSALNTEVPAPPFPPEMIDSDPRVPPFGVVPALAPRRLSDFETVTVSL